MSTQASVDGLALLEAVFLFSLGAFFLLAVFDFFSVVLAVPQRRGIRAKLVFAARKSRYIVERALVQTWVFSVVFAISRIVYYGCLKPHLLGNFQFLDTAIPGFSSFSGIEIIIPSVSVLGSLLLEKIRILKIGREFMRCGTDITSVVFNKYRYLSGEVDWKYFLLDLIGVLADDCGHMHIIRVTPKGYMRLHTAAAYLLGSNYASLYKGPERIWDLLRDHGMEDFYPQVLKKRRLKHGIRYVQFQDTDTSGAAITDFVGAGSPDGSFAVYRLPQGANLAVDDFSAFGHGNGSLLLKIHREDQRRVLNELHRISSLESHKQNDELERVVFRVVIQKLATPEGEDFPERIADFLSALHGSGPVQVA